MADLWQYFSYRDYLRDELNSRIARNPRYSLRAFARDLSLPVGQLSQVLNGVQGLSLAAGQKIARTLKLGATERKYFGDLVAMLHSRSFGAKREAERRVLAACRRRTKIIDFDTFLFIADWYHLALRELCSLPDFREDAAWMARRLGIPVETARLAWERLLRMGFVKRDSNGVSPDQGVLSTEDDQRHASGRTFHTQMMAKAERALHTQELPEREFANLVLAFDRERLPEAKRLIREFRNSFGPTLREGAPKPADAVYALSLQFFRLDQTERSQSFDNQGEA